MNIKKLLIWGIIGYGVYYLLKKKGILLGQGRKQFYPQRTTYWPGTPRY